MSYECMICDVLLLVNESMYDFAKMIHEPEQYVTLDDTIIDDIRCEAECSSDPKMK